jgi:hypothetical protein
METYLHVWDGEVFRDDDRCVVSMNACCHLVCFMINRPMTVELVKAMTLFDVKIHDGCFKDALEVALLVENYLTGLYNEFTDIHRAADKAVSYANTFLDPTSRTYNHLQFIETNLSAAINLCEQLYGVHYDILKKLKHQTEPNEDADEKNKLRELSERYDDLAKRHCFYKAFSKNVLSVAIQSNPNLSNEVSAKFGEGYAEWLKAQVKKQEDFTKPVKEVDNGGKD